jgi:ComF family protein
MITSSVENFILDILFPISCLSCGKDDTWLCPECLEKIKLLSAQVCPYCEKNITESGSICPLCKEKFVSKNSAIPLDNLIVAASYRENIIPRLIHTCKYNFVSDLSDPLGKIMIYAILKNNFPLPDLIIPVPLHRRRQRFRGFNQSELLADYIAENLTPGFPIPVLSNFIIRARYTKPQMKIKNYQERQKNIQNIFVANINNKTPGVFSPFGKGRSPEGTEGFEKQNYLDKDFLKSKTILLVDDVATTGATLFECGKTLKKYGAGKVFGTVIARQEIS